MKVDVISQVGAVVREVGSREHEGRPVRVVRASRTYPAAIEDVWDAITSPVRLPRWLAPVSGELRLGGRYQLEGNAGGSVTACEPPRSLAVTWEYGGDTSWVEVRLSKVSASETRLVLEHLQLESAHWKEFGPGAAGVGWDLALLGLDQYLEAGSTVDKEAWPASDEGKDFMRSSSRAWGEAAHAAGTDAEVARAAAARTAAFYTGEAV
jgi:uncharacterized protein YndB with AHSA1/START domain